VNRSFFADCRPGRPLQHLDQNPSFRVDSLQVLYEADRCLDLGFSVALDSILSTLPRERQTLLYSAKQTRSITALARLSLASPVLVSVHEHAAATPAGQNGGGKVELVTTCNHSAGRVGGHQVVLCPFPPPDCVTIVCPRSGPAVTSPLAT